MKPGVEWNDRAFKRELRNGVSRGMRSAVKFARDEVRAELSGPPGSAPGQPPGKVDGDLIRAVKHKVQRPKWGVVGIVGIFDDPEQAAKGARLGGGYAGTDSAGRTYTEPPRPWLLPVIRRNAKAILSRVLSGGFK